jgi:hypothetical protein
LEETYKEILGVIRQGRQTDRTSAMHRVYTRKRKEGIKEGRKPRRLIDEGWYTGQNAFALQNLASRRGHILAS